MSPAAQLIRVVRAQGGTLWPRIQWGVAGWAHRIGAAGVVGLLLLAIGSGMVVYSSLLLEPMLEAERALLEKSTAAARNEPALVSEARPAAGTRLDEFYTAFPEATEIPAVLGILVKLAERHGLSLEQGQYRLSAEPAGPLMRYQIKLPIRGPYARLRLMVEEVMHDVPAIALDSIQFKREAIDTPSLDAEVEFSLYVRSR